MGLFFIAFLFIYDIVNLSLGLAGLLFLSLTKGRGIPMPPTVTVFGAGYVGLTTAALLAATGTKTYLVEPNPDRLDVIMQGRSWFSEDGLDPLVAEGIRSRKLIPTSDYQVPIRSSQIVISCVGTPDLEDGSCDLSQVFSVARQVADCAEGNLLFVQKSTVPMGTGDDVEKLFADAGKPVSVLSNPEFLREGTAIFDSLFPDRVVVGGADKWAIAKIFSLYRQIERSRLQIAAKAGIPTSQSGRMSCLRAIAAKMGATRALPERPNYLAMDRTSAELVKVAANAFLATKISYANFIATLADEGGADARIVLNAIGQDGRIGRAFLRPGLGWGGGCFPKDVKALIAASMRHGVLPDILDGASSINARMPDHILNKVENALGKSLDGARSAVLGLSFKEGTSDTRRSPAIKLANRANRRGSNVRVYDPVAVEEAKPDLDGSIAIAQSVTDACNGAEVIFVAVRWPEFLNASPADYAAMAQPGAIFVDAGDAFDRQEIEDAGLVYIGIGR